MLQMRVGLALRHRAPAALAEQLLRDVLDRGGAELARDRADLVEPLVVVALDRLGARAQVAERVTVRGQRVLDAVDLRDAVERVEERRERIARRRDAGDVRRDRRQHVIAAEEDPQLGVVQADVVLGVTRGVQHEPVAPGEPQHVAVLDRVRDLGDEVAAAERPHHAPAHPLLERRARALAAPRRRAAPGSEAAAARGRLLGRLGRGLGDRALRVAGLLAQVLGRDLGGRGAGEPEAEVAVADHARAGLAHEARRAAEVVGVRVRDDHGVHVLQADPGLLQAILQRAPARRAGQPGVDQRGALTVDQRVAVHVPQPGHRDRELHAQHVRGDFRDLGPRLFLLLPFRHVRIVPDGGRRSMEAV